MKGPRRLQVASGGGGPVMGILNPTPQEFEEQVGRLLAHLGFLAEVTQPTADGGVDIVAVNDSPLVSGKYLVQCKRWEKPVGVEVIRELYGTVAAQRATKGILVTTSSFTRSAYEFAKGLPIELIDGQRLAELVESSGLSSIWFSDHFSLCIARAEKLVEEHQSYCEEILRKAEGVSAHPGPPRNLELSKYSRLVNGIVDKLGTLFEGDTVDDDPGDKESRQAGLDQLLQAGLDPEIVEKLRALPSDAPKKGSIAADDSAAEQKDQAEHLLGVAREIMERFSSEDFDLSAEIERSVFGPFRLEVEKYRKNLDLVLGLHRTILPVIPPTQWRDAHEALQEHLLHRLRSLVECQLQTLRRLCIIIGSIRYASVDFTLCLETLRACALTFIRFATSRPVY